MRLHRRQHRLNQQERAVRLTRGPAPLVRGDAFEARRQRQRRVVDEDVTRPKQLQRVPDDGFGAVGGGNVPVDRARAFANLTRDLVGARRVTHVDDDTRAALVQTAATRGPTRAPRP